jgi:hypothetical protein
MSGVPTRSPTHRDIEFAKLAPLGNEIEDMAEGEPVTAEQLIELANDRGRPPSHYFAASVLAADVELVSEHPIQAVFCAGKCQQWGALDCIDHALELREKKPGFDVLVKQCLDRCEHAAVCEIRTPDGTAVITQASPKKIEEALAGVT